MYSECPTKCQLCQGKVIYGRCEDFGIKPFQSGFCYVCTKCGAYVGTHKHAPQKALGVLGDKDIRSLRALCHKELEKHCQSLDGRNLFYYRLGVAMGYKNPKEECHFGYMSKEDLTKAYVIMNTALKNVICK